MTIRRFGEGVCLAAILVGVSGCPVPQRPGMGKQTILTEPRTGAQYFLYLPEAYIKTNAGPHPNTKNGKWPLVMTFHGMKPYDTWDRQAHEWEYEADNYGFIVCAPWLQSCDSFMEYPLRSEHSYVLKDKENVMAIMDHVFNTTRADPAAVLSTSFSCGGYMAHYFPNRFPARFQCIATRLSNFCADLLLDSTVPLYRNMPVAIFIGDGDFPACKAESEQAVAWYNARHFKKVEGKTIDNMGHQRIPQCAAAFFAEQIGIQPIHPERAAASLAIVRMTDYRPTGAMLAALTPRSSTLAMAPPPPSRSSSAYPSPYSPRLSPEPTRPVRNSPVQVASTDVPSSPFSRAEPSRPLSSPGDLSREPVNSGRPPSGAASFRTYDPPKRSWMKTPSREPSPDDVAKNLVADRSTQAPGEPRRYVSPPTQKRPTQYISPPTTPRRPTQVAARPPIQTPSRQTQLASASPTQTPARQPQPSAAISSPTQSRQAPTYRPREAGPRNYPSERLIVASSNDEPRRPRTTPSTSDDLMSQTDPSPRRTSAPPSLSAQHPTRPSPARPQPRPRETSVASSYQPRVSPPLSSASPAPTPAPSRARAHQVPILLSGPAVGTAPHYLAFWVNLPQDATRGADFLWMDNGMWISDEPRGAKILDMPGWHRLSVLVLTRDGREFRGETRVQVLAKGLASRTPRGQT